MRPLHVHLANLERLCPEGLSVEDMLAWLRAPIAGETLVTRLLQPLVGLSVERLTARPSRVAEAVTRCLPLFGLHLELEDGLDAADVVLPAQGLLEIDLPRWLRCAADARSLLQAEAVDATGARVGHVRIGFGVDRRQGSSRPIPSLRLWTTRSAFELLGTARRALEGDVSGLAARGTWDGPLLCGPHSRCEGDVLPPGPAHLGEGSTVETHARLAAGALIGSACFVARGALVGNALLLDGGTVRAGASLRDVVRLPSGLDLDATRGPESLISPLRRGA